MLFKKLMGRKKTNRTQVNKSARTKAKRCQFTMPPEDVELIDKLRAKYQRINLKENESIAVDIAKSEIIRAGLYALDELEDLTFRKIVDSIEVLAEGRQPNKQ